MLPLIPLLAAAAAKAGPALAAAGKAGASAGKIGAGAQKLAPFLQFGANVLGGGQQQPQSPVQIQPLGGMGQIAQLSPFISPQPMPAIQRQNYRGYVNGF